MERLFGGVIDWLLADETQCGVTGEFGTLVADRMRFDTGQHGTIMGVMVLLTVLEVTAMLYCKGTEEDAQCVCGMPSPSPSIEERRGD